MRSVFEVGFGTGRLLRHFLDDGAEVAGCDSGAREPDIDPEVVRRGRLSLEPLGPQQGPVADLVVGVHVVEHLADVHDALAAMVGRVRPGGLAFVTTPTADCWGFRRFGADWWMLEDPTHERFYSEQSLAKGLLAAGATAVVVGRPPLDSLGCDGASLARSWRRGRTAVDDEGVLAGLAGQLVSAGALAPTLVARTVPSVRPVLEAVAKVP